MKPGREKEDNKEIGMEENNVEVGEWRERRKCRSREVLYSFTHLLFKGQVNDSKLFLSQCFAMPLSR